MRSEIERQRNEIERLRTYNDNARESYGAKVAELVEAQSENERLRTQLRDQRCPSDVRSTIRECIAAKTCGCTNGLILGSDEQSVEK